MSDIVIKRDLGPRRDQSYLGDAVYASHDDFQIWLTVEYGAGVDQQIALDPSVYRALVAYARKIGMDESK